MSSAVDFTSQQEGNNISVQGRDLILLSGIFDIELYRKSTGIYFNSIDAAASHFMEVGEKAGINPNCLFDIEFYKASIGDSSALCATPLLHFIIVGASLGFDPSPLFCTSYYLHQYPDVASAEINPLGHFTVYGAKEGRNPHPLFCTAYYLKRCPEPDLAMEHPVAHYVAQGAAQGYDPHPLFSSFFYLARNTDVANSGINPLIHYVLHGAKEQRDPHPLFDTQYFLSHGGSSAPQKNTPLESYLALGARDNVTPTPLFYPRYYFEQHADALEADVPGLVHYLEIGSKLGYKPNPLFDPAYYKSTYPDVAASGSEPLSHYVQHGGAEGRTPGPWFDPSFYVSRYKDVAGAQVNPLAHYLEQGRLEGRYPVPPHYKQWWEAYQPMDEAHLSDVRAKINELNALPVFSIVVPVYNTPPDLLEKFVESVRRQVYPHWELCIADDASSEGYIRETLERYCASDNRIRVLFRETNGHISIATNSALSLASGDYICLMDHDDEITPDALYWLAAKIDENPALDMVYSDEDKMTMDDERYEPFLKPDWSPEYLESCMYTAHFACYRHSIVKEIGGFREGYHGAQDYDFVLRFTELTSRIAHVPRILYHWRAVPGSTAASMDQKSYAIDAALRALEDRLSRTGTPALVRKNVYDGCFDTRRAIVGHPRISIVIPSAGRSHMVRGQKIDILANCVGSITTNNTYRNFEIIVVDNNDLSESTKIFIENRGAKTVHFHKEFNIASKMNLGAAASSGEYILFLNDDVEVINPEWLESMLSVAQTQGVGAVGAKLHFEDGSLQHVGVTFCESLPDHIFRKYPGSHPGYFFSTVAKRNYLAVTGACMLVNRDVFNSVGGFDEKLPINYNDTDLCLNIHKAGYRIVYCPQAELFHYESLNRAHKVDANEIDYFLSKWRKYAENDPYYSNSFEARPPEFELSGMNPAKEELDKL